jgi:hypothetical protein
VIVPVTRKRVKMAPYGGKGGILHLPTSFFCFYYEHIINYPGSRGSLRGERNERRKGRAAGHIGCKSHFHT